MPYRTTVDRRTVATMTAVIRTDDLRKTYGRVHALDGLDLRVDAGQIHGFLGPNGAGKSTTIRILLGLARASGGSATLLGGDPWRDATRLHHRVASVPGDVDVWPNLSGGQAIDLLSRLRGSDTRSPAFRAERERLIDAFRFDPRTKGRAYSKGNRQKIALIAAFATPADVFILDEPTSGLDPLMELVFQQEVRHAHDRGATVLLSSHILSEVEQLCDHVSIVRAGRIVETGTLTDLRHLTRTEISFAGSSPVTIPDAHDVAVLDGRVSFTVDSDRVAAVLPAITALDPQGLRVNPPSLEELFLRHYGDDLTTAQA